MSATARNYYSPLGSLAGKDARAPGARWLHSIANGYSYGVAGLGFDVARLDALQGIASYAPANQAYTTANIRAKRDHMDELQRDATQAEAEAAAKRDAAATAEWEFHNVMLGANVQVEAQYGNNSDEFAALGNKKKKEYKRPTRRKPGSGS